MTLTVDAPSSFEVAKRGRWPIAYNVGPIFGGRTIVAMGNRPQDHMDRDLLLASLLRDRRLRMFRKQCLALPDWAQAVPSSVPTRFFRQAQQMTMLGSMHQYLIHRMRETIDLATNSCQAEKMLNAIENCLPRGALFSRTMLNPGRACGYAKLCPWCHARSVQRLYRNLLAGPCMPERMAGKHLISLRTHIEDDAELTASGVRQYRDDFRHSFRFAARSLGIEGGIVLHQATPWMTWDNGSRDKRKVSAHVFTLLGVLSSESVEAAYDDLDEVAIDTMMGYFETVMLPADTPQALRYLLFGSSYKFDSHELDLVVKHQRAIQYGIPGSASLEPWFLFDELQAWAYTTAMQGVRLYDTFGSWRTAQATTQQRVPRRRLASEWGNESRAMAFECKNYERQRKAYQRRLQLAEEALPYYQKLTTAGTKRIGSPALRKAMNDSGHAISDRDARWLVKELPTMVDQSGIESHTKLSASRVGILPAHSTHKQATT